VLVLEDLQWGDPETIAVLRGVLGRRPAARLLVIATYTPPEERSDIQPPRHLPRELQSLVPTTIVSLRPFTREHVATYLAARFGERAAVTITTAAAWASLGHPFLLGGFLETLINAQCLRREAYGWSASDVTSIMRAASLNMSTYYEWHIDRLGIGDRTILESAAVVGPQFTAEEVALALGTAGVAPISDRLNTLSDRGVLSIARPDGAMRERSIRYGFRHAGYGDLVARRAPVFERLRAAERLARTSKSHSRRA
jgi:predicted ATPase